jgi:hypothetical protein
MKPRTAAVLALIVFLLCCWIEPCDDSSGHSCTAAERAGR